MAIFVWPRQIRKRVCRDGSSRQRLYKQWWSISWQMTCCMATWPSYPSHREEAISYNLYISLSTGRPRYGYTCPETWVPNRNSTDGDGASPGSRRVTWRPSRPTHRIRRELRKHGKQRVLLCKSSCRQTMARYVWCTLYNCKMNQSQVCIGLHVPTCMSQSNSFRNCIGLHRVSDKSSQGFAFGLWAELVLRRFGIANFQSGTMPSQSIIGTMPQPLELLFVCFKLFITEQWKVCNCGHCISVMYLTPLFLVFRCFYKGI